MRIFFTLKPRNRFSPIKALNWFAADLQILLICKLQLSLSPILIPSNSTDDTTFKFWLLTTIRWYVWSLFLLSKKMAWNLSMILLFLNQSTAISDPDCKMSINSKKQIMCCHWQTCEARHRIQKKNKSFIYRLKNISPNIDPWGAPDIVFW